MTTLWMMILPLLFIAFFVLVIFKVLRVLSNKVKIRWTPKHIFVVVTGYIAFGLLAFLYLSFFYEPEITALSDEDVQQLEQEKVSLKKYYGENDSSFLTETHKNEMWRFEFEGDVLPISVNEGNTNLNFDIRIRYNDDIEHGSVFLSYYQSPVIVEGLDMTDEIPPPHVYLSNQQLIIEPASEHSISYNRVNASLSIIDFNRTDPYETEITEITESVDYQYSSVLLIEVARSTNVEDLKGLINIIN